MICNNMTKVPHVLVVVEVTCIGMMEIFHALEDEVCNSVEDEQHVLVLTVRWVFVDDRVVRWWWRSINVRLVGNHTSGYKAKCHRINKLHRPSPWPSPSSHF